MKKLVILTILTITSCSLFKIEEPIIVEKPIIKETKDSIKLDTNKFSIIDLINNIDTNNIIIDTLKSE